MNELVQVMTMKVSKCLGVPVVVAPPGVGHMPAAGEDEQEAARVLYLAATRATQRLVIGWVASQPLGGACDEITKPHTLPNNL